MSIITEIELAIKSYAKGLISESEAVDLIRDITNNVTIPVIDTYGLGPKLDPEAYGLSAKNGW
jgi:hypothetical protein